MEGFVLLLVIVLCILIVVLGIVAMIQFGEIAVLKGFPEKKTVFRQKRLHRNRQLRRKSFRICNMKKRWFAIEF